MARSAKAKKEKKKDFQKLKLKVGKTKAKSENFTDTSFRSQTINVLQQSLSTAAPSTTVQFSHHLNLLNHKSESQRRDSLTYLTSVVQSTQALPQATRVVLNKVQPLILDSSNAIRTQCVKFLKALPPHLVLDNVDELILYSRAALMHLSSKIRLTGLDILELLLNIAGPQVVGRTCGWTKMLSCMMSLLNWSKLDQSKASAKGWNTSITSQGQGVKSEEEVKARTRQLHVLALLLQIGLIDKDKAKEDVLDHDWTCSVWPLWQTHQHQLPSLSDPYAALNLWADSGSLANDICPTVDERYTEFEPLAADLRLGLESAKKEGGGIGRAAMSVDRILQTIYTR